jgi:hypothetical protein
MTRFILACIFYSSVAQWGYNEVALIFPDAIPLLNQAIHKVQIPTHNTWSRSGVEYYVNHAANYIDQVKDAVEDMKGLLDEGERMRRG